MEELGRESIFIKEKSIGLGGRIKDVQKSNTSAPPLYDVKPALNRTIIYIYIYNIFGV